MCPRIERTLFSKPAGISGCRVRIRASIGLSGRRESTTSLPPSARPSSCVGLSGLRGAFHVWNVAFRGRERTCTYGCPMRGGSPARDSRIGRPPVGTSLIRLATPSQGNKMYRCLSLLSPSFDSPASEGKRPRYLVPVVSFRLSFRYRQKDISYQLSKTYKLYYFLRVCATSKALCIVCEIWENNYKFIG